MWGWSLCQLPADGVQPGKILNVADQNLCKDLALIHAGVLLYPVP